MSAPKLPITEERTYLYYDGPMVFTGLDQDNMRWFLTAVPDQDDMHDAFIAVEVSEGEIAAMLEEVLLPYNLYAYSPNDVYLIGVDSGAPVYRLVDNISDDLLPDKGAHLNM